MKNLLIILFALASLGNIQAQTEKGNVAFGLHNFSALVPGTGFFAPTNAFGIYFGKSKSEFLGQTFEDKVTAVGLSGSAHYFIIDNLSGGINLNIFYQKQKEEYDDRDEYATTLLMFGPELRYYINAGAKTKVYLKGNASFGSANNKVNGEKQGDTTNLSQFAGGAGLSVFPNQNISIDLGLGYGAFKAKQGDDDPDTMSGLTVDIGFTVFL